MFEETLMIELAKHYPIPYFSYSQLNSFMQCPESYALTYLTKERKQNGNKYTILGSLLHDIFEREGKQKIFKENFFSKGQAIKHFNKEFMSFKDNEIKKAYFVDKEDFIKMYKKGLTAIENYYTIYSEETPLFVERKFQSTIAEGLPPSKSFIDRIDGLADDPSSWIVTDYKNGGSPKSKDYLRKDIQMGLYVAQIYSEFKAYPKAVQFVHPVPNKFQTAVHQGEGVYKFQGQRAPVVEFSVAETIMTARKVIAEIVTAIETDSFPLVRDAWNCKMCFHYVSGDCKPFNKQEKGWSNV